MATPPRGRSKSVPARPDSAKDLDRDGDMDAGDDRANDLNRDGRIDAADSEMHDTDDDHDIDAADRTLEEAPVESQSVGAKLGWSKTGGAWNRSDVPGHGADVPKQGPKP